MPTYIVLLGPPGAGKGTQARLVSDKLGLTHVSSGDLFREHLKNQTELGRLAKGYIDKGELVPDDVTIAMVRERISQPDAKKGALFDGFPRTPAQAEALDEILQVSGDKVDAVPYIQVADEVLIERLSGRWTCRAEGHIFHEKYQPPKQPGKCDFDGSDLYQRVDDRRETVVRRIGVYHEQTQPLIEYYRQRDLLIEIDGAQPIDRVTADLLSVLESAIEV